MKTNNKVKLGLFLLIFLVLDVYSTVLCLENGATQQWDLSPLIYYSDTLDFAFVFKVIFSLVLCAIFYVLEKTKAFFVIDIGLMTTTLITLFTVSNNFLIYADLIGSEFQVKFFITSICCLISMVITFYWLYDYYEPKIRKVSNEFGRDKTKKGRNQKANTRILH